MTSGAVKSETKVDLRNFHTNGHFWANAALVKNTHWKFPEGFFGLKASIFPKKTRISNLDIWTKCEDSVKKSAHKRPQIGHYPGHNKR